MQHPNIVLNWAAIAASIVAAFIFGFLWHGPLFGKTWARLMGFEMKADCKPSPGFMVKAMSLQILGTFLTAFVLSHNIQAWLPSSWGVGADGPAYMTGFYGGFFTWLGFYVPVQLRKPTWEMKPWGLFFINTGHDFISLQLIAQILAHMH